MFQHAVPDFLLLDDFLMFETFKFRAFKAYLVSCIIHLHSLMKDPSRLISIPKDTGKPECHKVIIIFDEEQVTTLMMVIKHFVVGGSNVT